MCAKDSANKDESVTGETDHPTERGNENESDDTSSSFISVEMDTSGESNEVSWTAEGNGTSLESSEAVVKSSIDGNDGMEQRIDDIDNSESILVESYSISDSAYDTNGNINTVQESDANSTVDVTLEEHNIANVDGNVITVQESGIIINSSDITVLESDCMSDYITLEGDDATVQNPSIIEDSMMEESVVMLERNDATMMGEIDIKVEEDNPMMTEESDSALDETDDPLSQNNVETYKNDSILEQSEVETKKCSIARNEEYSIAQNEECSIAQNEECSIAQNEECSIAQNEECSITQNEECSITQNEECSIAQNEECSIAQNEEYSIAQNEESSVTQNEECSIAQNEEYSIAQNEESSIAQNEEYSIIRNEEYSITQNEECSIAQNEECSIAQNEECSIAQNEESSIAQNEECRIAQNESDAMLDQSNAMFESVAVDRSGDVMQENFSLIESNDNALDENSTTTIDISYNSVEYDSSLDELNALGADYSSLVPTDNSEESEEASEPNPIIELLQIASPPNEDFESSTLDTSVDNVSNEELSFLDNRDEDDEDEEEKDDNNDNDDDEEEMYSIDNIIVGFNEEEEEDEKEEEEPAIDEAEIAKALIFFKERNLTASENALKEELLTKNGTIPYIEKDLKNEISIYADLISFISTSDYKDELSVVLFPVFAHTYMDFAMANKTVAAETFMRTYGHSHPDYFQKFIDSLIYCSNRVCLNCNSDVVLFKDTKFSLRLSRSAMEHLKRFSMKKGGKSVISRVLCKNITVETYEVPRTTAEINLTSGAILGEARRAENKFKIFYGVSKERELHYILPAEEEDDVDGGGDDSKPKKKKAKREPVIPTRKVRHDPNAPPIDRIPLPPL